MRKYEFSVSGASPGLGSVIVVLAEQRNLARQIAEQEVERMNARRAELNWALVTLDDEVSSASITLPGVVYSYDGEA